MVQEHVAKKIQNEAMDSIGFNFFWRVCGDSLSIYVSHSSEMKMLVNDGQFRFLAIEIHKIDSLFVLNPFLLFLTMKK